MLRMTITATTAVQNISTAKRAYRRIEAPTIGLGIDKDAGMALLMMNPANGADSLPIPLPCCIKF